MILMYSNEVIWLFITLVLKFLGPFSYSLAQQLRGLLFNFDWLVHKVECETLQLIIVIYRRDNFVHLHWGCNCTSIYRPLFYLFRSQQVIAYNM